MKIQHKRSNQLDGGSAKEPTSEFMEYGELAVNFNESDPAIFLKDSNDNIVRIAGAGANGNIEIPDAGSDPHQPGTSDDRYVEVTGDNMTGDLTLGTDKITLNATDGKATFASEIKAPVFRSANNNAVISETTADKSGSIRLTNGTASNNEYVPINITANDTSKSTFTVTQFGENSKLELGGTGADASIILNSNGGYAEFGGRITGNSDGVIAKRLWAGNSAQVDGLDIGVSAFAKSDLATGAAVYAKQFNSDGNLYIGLDRDSNTVFKVEENGSASFAGNIDAGNVFFNLEPDNPANYTTTTEEYTEIESYTGPLGNTLEREVTKTRDVLTYTGPTLDVKDRLQNLLARVDAMEANEIVDDATDSSLLQLVASLTARLDEKDAAIASLTSSLTALTSRVTTLET